MDGGKRKRLAQALRGIVGREAVLDADADLILYEYDASIEHARPDLVVLPCDTAQVAEIVRLCGRSGVPYVARGAGTGLSGGSVPVAGGLVISMARLNRILEIDLDSRVAVVEPGVVNLELNNALARHGYWYAPDPASQKASTLGGNAAENAGGPHCLKYGVTTNHVLGLEVVLPEGQVIQTGGKAPDRPGYDLTGLFVGSEGTLGIITKLVVRISPRPERLRTMLAVFAGVDDASRAVSEIIAAGILPATLEMMDSFIIRAVEDFFHAGYPSDAGAVLIIEVDGIEAGLERQTRSIAEICRRSGASDVREARSEEDRQRLWQARLGFLSAIYQISPGHITADGTVPRGRLPQVLARVVDVGRRYGLSIGNVFHAGDGNLHPIVLLDPSHPDERERAMQACQEIMRICVEAGGTISGEHGIGTEKIGAMALLFGEPEMRAMQAIKTSLDPQGLCNPRKIFPSPEAGTGQAPGQPALIEHRPVGNQSLTDVLDLDVENLTVTVQAGMTLGSLQERLRTAGLKAPLDPPYAQIATVGEIVTSARSGPRRLLYGAPRDHVLGIRVALTSGETIRIGGKTVKNVAGYDLTRLFLGSEGTLGQILEVTLRLRPLPEVERTLIMNLNSPAAAGEVLRGILRSPRWLPAALVLLNPCAAGQVAGPVAGFALELEGPWQLVIGLEGFSEEVEQQGRELSELTDVLDMGPAVEFWRLLGDGLSTDAVARAGVPIGEVSRFMQQVEIEAASLGIECPVVAQAGTGLVRLFPQWVTENPRPWLNLLVQARSAAISLGGYLTLEDWPAELKTEWDSPAAVRGTSHELMRRIKAVFDPEGNLGPIPHAGE